jgi:GrpB-like predicted nucleotidyltransferase (UPF0157 family)
MQFLHPRSYQPLARRVFSSLSREIRRKLPTAIVEHIGSSSIPGLWSKGDLDVYVGVAPEAFADAIAALKTLGFVEKRGTLRNKSLWPFEVPGYELDTGIQLVAIGSRFEYFRNFRDLLKSNARLRANYNRLKKASSHLNSNSYRRAKSRFIERLLKDNACG